MIRNSLAILAALGVLSSATTGLRAQGLREGIGVRGHWVLEVLNPDSGVAERREFDNRLIFGDEVLTALLVRGASMGAWRVRLVTGRTSGLTSPFRKAGQPVAAVLDEATVPPGFYPTSTESDQVFSTLTVSGTNFGKMVVLNGSAMADSTGDIQSVVTTPVLCAPTVAPATMCTFREASGTREFNGTDVKNAAGELAPLHLVAGQSVRVTVTISFSTAGYYAPPIE